MKKHIRLVSWTIPSIYRYQILKKYKKKWTEAIKDSKILTERETERERAHDSIQVFSFGVFCGMASIIIHQGKRRPNNKYTNKTNKKKPTHP